MKILLSLLIIIFIIKSIKTNNLKHQERGWESICSILSCKPVLDNCIRKSCLGKDDCRNCVQSENQMCVRCVDGLLNEQDYTINGKPTIECDSANNLPQTTCNFYCRIKESLAWKCEQRGGYPLCNCESKPLGSLISKILRKNNRRTKISILTLVVFYLFLKRR
jgi:hypothetical protein